MRASFEQLEAFVTTHSEGSFSAAARKCNKVQSVISTLVANLEVDLNVELFDRSRRYPTLTDAGEMLISQAEILLERRSRFLAIADALSMTLENRITLAMAPHIKLANLGEIIRTFNADFPSVDVEIQSFAAGDIQRLVVQGEVDLGIILEPEGIPQSLDFRSLGSLKLVCVSHPESPLSHTPSVSWEELRLHRQILLKEADNPNSAILKASPSIWQVSTATEAIDLVRADLGWSALPLHAVDIFVQTGALKILPLQFETKPYAERSVDMVWSFEKPMGQATAKLCELLAENAVIQNSTMA
ncbi:LysR family transcriptional regulator [Roseibium sp. RKSG952]|uniref:LysR family transcriptional regulator n=1 Tax=Roseibium sp. RKSG952 TaxID=2529384 RepID=UPI0012BD6539|nr:LysR family transcriptional regulator [Roseibium sp. RKSG952]MTI01901.1 LysR family transcriptional regulator [Roseibium sp. RKSG952]